jgi:hypothetical protein
MAVKRKRKIHFVMSRRKSEIHRVRVRADSIGYRLTDTLSHTFIVLTISHLSDYQSAYPFQNAAHFQVAHHSVDMVVPLAHVFEKENNRLGRLSDEFVQAPRRSLQTVQHAQVAACHTSFRFSISVKRMSGQTIGQSLPFDGLFPFQDILSTGIIPVLTAHHSVQGLSAVHGAPLVQNRYVRKTYYQRH